MIRAGDSIVNSVTGERLVCFDVVRLPRIPHVLQKAALLPGALLGQALGYGATYERIGGITATA